MPEYHYKGQHTQTFQKLPGYKKLIAWQSASDLSTRQNITPQIDT